MKRGEVMYKRRWKGKKPNGEASSCGVDEGKEREN